MAAAPAVAAARRNPWIRGAFLTVLIFGGAFLALVLVNRLQEHQRHNRYVAAQSQLQVPQPQLHRTTIGSGAITVNAANYLYFAITVPSGANNVKLAGHFTASGGSGNDIEVFVLNQDGCTNWTNHHSTPTYYNSGKVTTGELDVMLPDNAGIYYLVFSNVFSILTPKAVEENIALTYYSL